MNAVKKRKLSDLFRRGEDVSITDGDDTITVYLRKLNPSEEETAVRKANAARARYLAACKDHDSETFLATLSDLLDFTRDQLLDYAASDELVRNAQVLEEEYAAAEEWSNDDYLQGIYEAWEGGLKDRYHEDDDGTDEEAQKVWKEIERYNQGLEALFEKERKKYRRDFEKMDEDEVRNEMAERLSKMQADLVWLVEHHKWEVYLGTRDITDRKSPYFESKEEVDELPEEVLTFLTKAYRDLNVEVDQGKDSPETATS